MNQSNAIGIAVMQARDQRRAALVTLDKVELPERAVLVERAGRELADESLERALLRALPRRAAPVAAARQRGELHVPVDVEVGVVLPDRAGGTIDGLLPEARIGQEAFRDHALEPVERH